MTTIVVAFTLLAMATDPGLSALVIVAHGSPDADWRRPVQATCARMRELDPLRTILDAYLDYDEPSLESAVRQLAASGHSEIVVVAAFLSAGGRHLKEDLPARVGALAKSLPEVSLRLCEGALGSEPDVVEALARAALRRLFLG